MVNKKYLLIGIFILVIAAGVFLSNFLFYGEDLVACTEDARICPDGTGVGRVGPDCEFEECPSYGEENYCDADSRLADACIKIYQPVCGWMDGEKIQCFAYPCAQTFSNSCFACMDENVLYWTDGGCPGIGG